MKLSLTTRIVCSVLAGLVPLILYGHDKGGPDPRHTGGPGDDPLACSSSGCHTGLIQGGPINAFGGGVSATFSQGSTYTLGSPVNITVKVTDPGGPHAFGFQMSARLESDLSNAQAGRFQPTSGLGVLCDDGDSGIPRSTNGNCPQNFPLEFVEHTKAFTTNTFTFSWTPTATVSGPVHFYLAGNAANGNGSEDSDDHIYTNAYVLEPAGDCVAGLPKIDKVISPKGYGGRTDFAPNTWVEITGQNFSSTTRVWLGADFDGVQSPVLNDKVRVKINGKDAFVWYISPTQINANTPDNAGEGPMDVVVTNCTQNSAPFTLTQHGQAPGLLAPDIWVFNARQYLIALFLDGTTFVGNIPIPGIASRAAKSGDMIVTYGVGFGATDPAIPAGTYPVTTANLVAPVTLTVGGAVVPPGDIFYAGLSPFSVGLYQFVFKVPNLPDGDQLVEMRLGGELVPPESYITVKN